jgi:hypothetical protein
VATSDTQDPSSHLKGLFEGHVTGVPQGFDFKTHVASPAQNFKLSGHPIVEGQLFTLLRHELSDAHLVGLSAGQYEFDGQSARLARQDPSEKQWYGKEY